jgi:hypothetical protein
MTPEAFAQAHDLPLRWLELRRACEDIVKHADFWYRSDLRQQAGDLAIRASDILDSRLIETARRRLDHSDVPVIPLPK